MYRETVALRTGTPFRRSLINAHWLLRVVTLTNVFAAAPAFESRNEFRMKRRLARGEAEDECSLGEIGFSRDKKAGRFDPFFGAKS